MTFLRSGALLIVVMCLPLIASGQTATTKPTPKKPATPPSGVLSAAMITAIQSVVKDAQKEYRNFFGLSDYAGGSMRLSVMSNLTLIAWKTQQAVESGGRFNPPASMRSDVVTVDCGDSDLGDIFNCGRVRVRLPSGQIAKPLAYRSGPNQYRNAMGAKWTVREVDATYPTKDLRNGFTVDYADDGGSEWTFEVTSDQAAEELLLRLDADGSLNGPPPLLLKPIRRVP